MRIFYLLTIFFILCCHEIYYQNDRIAETDRIADVH
jgi:hypothetical protein